MNLEHWNVIEQPNKRFAIFSNKARAFIVADATRNEVRAFFHAQADERVEQILDREFRDAEHAAKSPIIWIDTKATHLANASAVRADPDLAYIIEKL